LALASSGTLSLKDNSRVGSFSGSSGTILLSSGTLNNLNGAWLLELGILGAGTVIQSGGFVRYAYVDLADNASSMGGYYRLENGTLHVAALRVGRYASGTFLQNGGTVTATASGGAIS